MGLYGIHDAAGSNLPNHLLADKEAGAKKDHVNRNPQSATGQTVIRADFAK